MDAARFLCSRWLSEASEEQLWGVKVVIVVTNADRFDRSKHTSEPPDAVATFLKYIARQEQWDTCTKLHSNIVTSEYEELMWRTELLDKSTRNYTYRNYQSSTGCLVVHTYIDQVWSGAALAGRQGAWVAVARISYIRMFFILPTVINLTVCNAIRPHKVYKVQRLISKPFLCNVPEPIPVDKVENKRCKTEHSGLGRPLSVAVCSGSVVKVSLTSTWKFEARNAS